jgi:hypothetical protein
VNLLQEIATHHDLNHTTNKLTELQNRTHFRLCDDILEFSAQKTGTGKVKKKLPLVENYRSLMDISRDNKGCPILVGYIHKVTGEYLPVKQCPVALSREWTICFERRLNVDDNICIISCGNQVIIRLINLSYFYGSRYQSALDAIIDCGLFEYSPRKKESTRNRREAMRNVLIRHFSPYLYEFAILFDHRLGKLLRPFISGYKKVENTTYFQEVKKYALTHSKFYNTSAAARQDFGENYQDTDLLKFETTFLSRFFKQQDITVRMLTTQTDIFILIRDKLSKEFIRNILNKLKSNPKAWRVMKKITGKSNQVDLVDYIFDIGNVQAEYRREVNRLRNDLTKAECKIEKLNHLLTKNQKDNLLKFSELYDKVNVLEKVLIDPRKVRDNPNQKINKGFH